MSEFNNTAASLVSGYVSLCAVSLLSGIDKHFFLSRRRFLPQASGSSGAPAYTEASRRISLRLAASASSR